MGSVLWCIEFEEAAGLVRVDSSIRNVDVWTFLHVIHFGQDKLNMVKYSCQGR